MTKKAGEMWKKGQISADQSQRFEETYKAAQEEHKRQMKTHSAQKAGLPVAPLLKNRDLVFFTNASSIILMWCWRC